MTQRRSEGPRPREPRSASDRLVRDSGGPDPLRRLIEIMRRLRDPADGCPWDQKQSFASIGPYAVEEAYELLDAIERNDPIDMRDELGDVLLQVVYHSQMADEADLFDFADVAEASADKMVRRHPHVFGDAEAADWDAIKAAEKAERAARRRALGAPREPTGLLDDVPRALPALSRAVKLQRAAAQVGFDWPKAAQIFDKLREEEAELREALALEADAAGSDAPDPPLSAAARAHAAEELGDMLFVLANLARRIGVEPEAALEGANKKFTRRFGHIEATLRERGNDIGAASLEEMEALWREAKFAERAAPKGAHEGADPSSDMDADSQS